MGFPPVIERDGTPGDPGSWLREHQDRIDALLDTVGAVLLRGTGITGADGFRAAADVLAGPLMDYGEGASPRSPRGGAVYTSTEYDPARAIALHNELSYSSRWPGRLGLCCITPPAAGGQTPVADGRAVYARILATCPGPLPLSVRYVRHMHDGKGPGVGWPEAFGTADPGQAEAYCQAAGIDCTWLPGRVLRTSQVRPAAIVHPRTGEPVWFNQAHQWHPSNDGPDTEALLRDLFGDRLPMTAQNANGTEIDPAVLAAVRDAYRAEQAQFDWQPGDLLLLDNMLCAHGRAPFTGPRDILVAMGRTVRLDQVKAVTSHD
jgi:alpha-ketoglutarate-dependent taurine dioxygenase